MVHKFVNDTALINARQNRKVLHSKNILPDTVSWDEAFYYLDDLVNKKDNFEARRMFGIITQTARNISKVNDVCKEIDIIENRIDNNKPSDAHMYLSLTTQYDGFGPHHDDCEVIFWQCIGKTQWDVEDTKYILSPGDCLYIPQGVVHGVTTLSPRMGISFGF